MSNTFKSWWGRHQAEQDRTDYWQIGPLKMWLQSLPFCINIRFTNDGDFLDAQLRSLPGSRDPSTEALVDFPGNAASLTCAFGHRTPKDAAQNSPLEIGLSPALPDRSVVVRLNEA